MKKIKILAYILIVLSIFYIPFSPLNYGSYFPALLGIYLLIYAYLKDRHKFLYRIMQVCLWYFIITFSIYSVLSIKSLFNEDRPYDAIIVLGSGLDKDGSVSTTLQKRLDKCIEIYDGEKPIVVSGGQGDDEITTEAYAMSQYLIKNGISEEKIILEDKSRTTKENFLFSKVLLDEQFSSDYTVAYITNDFHSFRAGLYMNDAGLNGFGISSTTPFYMVPSCYLRDYISLYKYIIFR